MIVSAFLAAWLLSGVTASLDEAQQAFAQKDYVTSERLALLEAKPPTEGAALYLVGLSRFRQGRHEEALEALQRAQKAADAPEVTLWQFNKGACLFALGRLQEAEEAFLSASANEELKAAALVEAAWAAFELESLARAKAHLEEAQAAAGKEVGQELWALLDENIEKAKTAYGLGLSAFDAGNFETARTHFLEALKLDENFGAAHIMSGASAFRLGLRREALEEWTQARRCDLTSEEAGATEEYLRQLSSGLGAHKEGLSWEAQFLGGVDTNVQQAGVGRREGFLPQSLDNASPFVDAVAWAGFRSPQWAGFLSEASMSFSQRAYSQSDAQDYSLQNSRLMASIERPLSSFRLGASAFTDMSFTGLSSFRGLLYGGGGSVFAAFEPSVEWGTRLTLGANGRNAFLSEFEYLAGFRWNVLAMAYWQRGPWRVSGVLGYRDEMLGTLTQATTVSFPRLCRGPCESAQYVLPFAWKGPSSGAEVRYRWPTGQWLRLEGDVEYRAYAGTTYLKIADTLGGQRVVNERERVDVRYSGALTGAWPFRFGELSLQYDWVWNTSNIDTRLEDIPGECTLSNTRCHALDATNANYVKHVLNVGWAF